MRRADALSDRDNGRELLKVMDCIWHLRETAMDDGPIDLASSVEQIPSKSKSIVPTSISWTTSARSCQSNDDKPILLNSSDPMIWLLLLKNAKW